MIRIKRSTCPPCLADAPSEGDFYRKSQVVTALWDMQHGKCCYSEMPLPDHGHGKHVEHFHPKDVFTWMRNEWSNLLLVCPQCNGRKSNRFPGVSLTQFEDGDEATVVYLQTPSDDETSAIIDPSDPDGDDPELHLTYVLDDRDSLYGQIIPRNNSGRGRATIEITGIDDGVFFRERFDRLIDVLEVHYRLLLRASRDGDADALSAQRTTFTGFLESRAKYAGLAREYAKSKKLDQRFQINVSGDVGT